jgi:hypothetical protein
MTMLLAACGNSRGISDIRCMPSGQRPMVVAELFFDRFIPERTQLSEAEWRTFAAEIVTPNFPDGFTAYDAEGQWRNPETGAIAREPTKVLLVATPSSPDIETRLSAVIEAYKARFRQHLRRVLIRIQAELRIALRLSDFPR